jgi:hypothetical protein
MKSDLQSKVTTLLTGCDTECQRTRELNKLKTEYEEYLRKYIQTYYEYQKIQYGQTLDEKKFQREYEKRSKEFNNKMKYIENVLKSDIKEVNDIIKRQKIIIREKNIMLNKTNVEIIKRKKIINGLTDNLVTDKGQQDNFNDHLLKRISIFPYGPLKRLTFNYNRSTYYLLLLLIVILTIIIILIYKIIV